MGREWEEITTQVQELRSNLEKCQSQQAEDSRTMSKQQKTTERYLAKRHMMVAQKDECNRNIRASRRSIRYINEKLEKVCFLIY